MKVLFNDDKRSLLWSRYISGAALTALYIYVAWSSFGYDDEYFNIRVVEENSLAGMVRLVQSTDLHPPLSYIINYLLYQVTGNWNMVRVTSSLLFLASLFYYVSKITDRRSRLLALLLLGLNPAILLWGTGIRWYAYLLPVLMILTVLPDHRKWYYWPRFFLLMLVTCFLGYVGFFLFVPYFLFYWLNDKDDTVKKLRKIFLPALVFVSVYAYQFYIFLSVHSKMNLSETSNRQVFDLRDSLASWVSSVAGNQGIFPVSLWGICSVIGAAILYLAALLAFREANRQKHGLVFLIGSVLFIVSGIAGKIRNLMLLEPSRNSLFLSIPHKTGVWVMTGFLLLLAGNAAGVYHVIMHKQTTKNAWNIPLQETIEKIAQMEMPGRKEICFTHHPTFTFYLVRMGKDPVSLYNTLYFDSSAVKERLRDFSRDTTAGKNLVFILTYQGRSMADSVYSRMMGSMKNVTADSVKHVYLGRDADHTAKRKFFPGYPEYTVEIVKYYGVKRLGPELMVWETGH